MPPRKRGHVLIPLAGDEKVSILYLGLFLYVHVVRGGSIGTRYRVLIELTTPSRNIVDVLIEY